MENKPQGIMLHSVGCAQPNAQVFLRLWNQEGVQIGVHGIVDGLTGNTYQCLQWNWQGWHAGGTANRTYIGIEMCEPAQIKYKGYSDQFYISDSDKPDASLIVARTYTGAVSTFAHLCLQYDLDPLEEGVILSHNEGGKKGIASGHTDPEHLWKGLGLPYTMKGFRSDVNAVKKKLAEKTKDGVLYRVQCGAFSRLDYATEYRERLKKAGFDDAFIIKVE